MATTSVKVNTDHQITIPTQVRKHLKIKRGIRLVVDVQDGMMILLPLHQRCTQSLAGLPREILGNTAEYVVRERSVWIDFMKP